MKQNGGGKKSKERGLVGRSYERLQNLIDVVVWISEI